MSRKLPADCPCSRALDLELGPKRWFIDRAKGSDLLASSHTSTPHRGRARSCHSGRVAGAAACGRAQKAAKGRRQTSVMFRSQADGPLPRARAAELSLGRLSFVGGVSACDQEGRLGSTLRRPRTLLNMNQCSGRSHAIRAWQKAKPYGTTKAHLALPQVFRRRSMQRRSDLPFSTDSRS